MPGSLIKCLDEIEYAFRYLEPFQRVLLPNNTFIRKGIYSLQNWQYNLSQDCPTNSVHVQKVDLMVV